MASWDLPTSLTLPTLCSSANQGQTRIYLGKLFVSYIVILLRCTQKASVYIFRSHYSILVINSTSKNLLPTTIFLTYSKKSFISKGKFPNRVRVSVNLTSSTKCNITVFFGHPESRFKPPLS